MCGFPSEQVPPPVLQDQQVHPSGLLVFLMILLLSTRASFSPFRPFLDLQISSFPQLCRSEENWGKKIIEMILGHYIYMYKQLMPGSSWGQETIFSTFFFGNNFLSSTLVITERSLSSPILKYFMKPRK